MATVSLTLSETLDGSAIADSLSNGGSGTSLGQVTNSSFAPITPPASNNVGRQDWFLRHDAIVDSITDVKIHLQQYGVGTGYSYGGPGNRSAANDYNTVKAEGFASGSNKTNGDGLSSGIWMEMSVAQMISVTNQFDQATRPTQVKIFGDNNTDGIDLASAFVINSAAMVIDTDQSAGGNGTAGYIPTAPVSGEIGKNGNTVKGDNAHIALRVYLRTAFSEGGVFQVELVFVYTFTA